MITNCVVGGCEWHMHAILNRSNGAFHVNEVQNEHNCGSTNRTNKHKCVTSSLVANEVVGVVEKAQDYPNRHAEFLYGQVWS